MSGVGQELLIGGITALPGWFCLWHVWHDTDWFFKNSKAAFWVDVFGGKGARWFYAALGFFFLIIAVLSTCLHLK
jgi:hypothetical protein